MSENGMSEGGTGGGRKSEGGIGVLTIVPFGPLVCPLWALA